MLYGRRSRLDLAKATIARRSPLIEREMRVIDESGKVLATAKPPAKPKAAKATPAKGGKS